MHFRYLILALALAGCAALHQPTPYDAVLYNKYVKVTSIVFNTIPKCSDQKVVVANVGKMLSTLDEALIYEKYRDEPQLSAATTLIKGNLNQLLETYAKTPNPGVTSNNYCRLKLQIEEASLISILQAVGGKPQ